MAEKIQLNIRLAEDEHGQLLRWAGETGMERGAFARHLIVECLEAKSEGRATFEREQLGPGDLIALKAALSEGLMEIHRIAETWAAHEAEMHALERKDQLALHAARAEFLAGFPERIVGSLNPIRAEMAAMMKAIAEQPRLDAIDRGQEALVAAVRENTSAIAEVRKDPRRITGIVLGDGRLWSTAFVCQWSLLMAGLGLLFSAAIGSVVPAFGIPLAHRMVAGDSEFCRLVRYRFESEACQVPAAHRVEAAAQRSPEVPSLRRRKVRASAPKVDRS